MWWWVLMQCVIFGIAFYMSYQMTICDDPRCSTCASIFNRPSEKKAKELFVSLLTPAQKKEMKQLGTVTEKGLSGEVYTINLRGVVSNVRVKGRGTLCIYMVGPGRGGLPLYDHFIGQLLHIRYNETGFRRRAIASYW